MAWMGVPLSAKMSMPSCLRPPERGAPKVSTSFAPETGCTEPETTLVATAPVCPGPAAGGTMEDDPLVRIELRHVIRAGRVGVELEYPARGVDRAGDHSGYLALFGLAQVDEHHLRIR